jgi:hypothetical protein
MIKPREKVSAAKAQKTVLKEISKLREQLDDLHDYLDLLDARARNQGKPRLSMDNMRAKLGLS